MTRVFRVTELREKSLSELTEMAKELNLPVLSDKEELIRTIVHSSYPVKEISNSRLSSRRGIVINGFIGAAGRPYSQGTMVSKIVDDLVEQFDMTREDAEATVKLYKRDLVRYYGYDIISEDEGVVKLSDARRRDTLYRGRGDN